MSIFNEIDPYTIPISEFRSSENDNPEWLAVTYPNVINYSLLSTSSYTSEMLNFYKSLEAYNQFCNRWEHNSNFMIILNKEIVSTPGQGECWFTSIMKIT